MVGRLALVALLLSGCAAKDDPPGRPPLDMRTAALVVRAERAVNASKLALAEAIIDTLERSSPGLAESRLLRAKLLAVAGRLDEAQAAYETLIDSGFAPPGLHHNAGEIAFRRNRFEEALAHFDEELMLEETAMSHHAKGIVYERLGHSDSARAAFERAITLDRSFAPGEQSLARWYEQAGQYEAALRHIDRALKIDSANGQFQSSRALLLSLAGRDDEAIPALERALKSDPNDYGVRFAYSRALRRSGRVEAADQQLSLAEQSRERMAEVELLRSSVADLPHNDRLRRDLAERLREIGLWEEALLHYAVLERRNPENLEIRANLATLHMQVGDTAEALRQYGRVLATDSTHVETWLNLGYYYARIGERDRAKEAWRRAMAHGPDHPGVQQLRALTLPT